MLRRTLQTLVVLIGLGPAVAMAQEGSELLAERLPAAQTAVYAHVSIRRVLEEAERGVAFVDPEAAQTIVYQVRDLYDVLRELAAGYEFQPTLFDNIADMELYFVLMKKDEPEVRVETYEVPKFDDVIPWEEGEGEPHPPPTAVKTTRAEATSPKENPPSRPKQNGTQHDAVDRPTSPSSIEPITYDTCRNRSTDANPLPLPLHFDFV